MPTYEFANCIMPGCSSPKQLSNGFDQSPVPMPDLFAGSKAELANNLAMLYVDATREGISPEAYRDRQLANEGGRRLNVKAGAQTDQSDPMNWSLIELREAVKRRGVQPKGRCQNRMLAQTSDHLAWQGSALPHSDGSWL